MFGLPASIVSRDDKILVYTAAPVPLPVKVVQSAWSTGLAGTTTAAVPLEVTRQGNCLVVVAVTANATTNATISAVTANGQAGNFGSLYTEGTGSSPAIVSVWADPACAGGLTEVEVTTTGGAGASLMSLLVLEVQGLAATLAGLLDQAAGATGSGTAWSSGATAATTQASELWIGAAGALSPAQPSNLFTGPGEPWTGLNVSANPFAAGYQVVAAEGAAEWAGTAQASTDWTAAVVTLKPATPGTLLGAMSAAAFTDATGNQIPQGTLIRAGLIEGAEFRQLNDYGAYLWYADTSGDEFWYADTGTGAQGPLIAASAHTAGTDPLDGTAYPAGFSVQAGGAMQVIGTAGQVIALAVVDGAPQLQFITGASYEAAAGYLSMAENGSGGTAYLSTTLTSPRTSGSSETVQVFLSSQSEDGTSFPAGGNLLYHGSIYLTWGASGITVNSPIAGDANSYQTERATAMLSVPLTVDSTAGVQISPTWNPGAGQYHLHGQIIIGPTTTGGFAIFSLGAGAGLTVSYMGVAVSETVFGAPTTLGNSGFVEAIDSPYNSAVLSDTTLHCYEFDGVLSLSAGGTLALFAQTNGTGAFTVERLGTYFELNPIGS